MLEFLNGHLDISRVNETFLVLIPKIKIPTKVIEFRPISLYNVIWKLISKTLTRRLQEVLLEIIDVSQSAFIKDRLIMDNAILGIEAFHSMKVGRLGKCRNKLFNFKICRSIVNTGRTQRKL